MGFKLIAVLPFDSCCSTASLQTHSWEARWLLFIHATINAVGDLLCAIGSGTSGAIFHLYLLTLLKLDTEFLSPILCPAVPLTRGVGGRGQRQHREPHLPPCDKAFLQGIPRARPQHIWNGNYSSRRWACAQAVWGICALKPLPARIRKSIVKKSWRV